MFVFSVWLFTLGSWFWLPKLGFELFEFPVGPGEFGDTFGALNALFTGLAFAGVIIAILLQRESIKQQNEDLKIQRKYVQRSGEALEMELFWRSTEFALNHHTELVICIWILPRIYSLT